MLLRAVTLSIALLLAAFLAACYWFGWRPLGEVSGSITAPISATATISRDTLGVPHIKAASLEDVLTLEGYAMAQDRLWQMDGMRRRAAGELAEVVGPAALARDQEARRYRLGRLAQAQEASLPSQQRAALAAFARGVNHFINTHRGRLPLEFALLRYEPRPWTVRDSLLAGLEMYRSLTQGWRSELLKQRLIEAGSREKIDYLFQTGMDSGVQPGSNAWAISGTHTASGKPIVANDPHLEYSLPSVWYLAHLDAPGLQVSGATIVGIPGIIVGHNQRIAWGVTNLEFDVQDLYREQLDMQTGRYTVAGQVEQALGEPDIIPVRGAQPARMLTWVTRHGPIFALENGQPYALRWTAATPGGFTFPFLEIDQAKNWREFRTAVSHFAGPGQNFVYADVDGNIGYQASGHLPARKGCLGDIPTDGTRDLCDWPSYIPFEALPSVYNPPSGIVVTANQSTFASDTPFAVHGNFAAPYRARQIRDRLAAREHWNAREMLGVQTDVYSGFLHFLAKQTVKAYDSAGHGEARFPEPIDVLRHWNGQMENGQGGAMLAALLFAQVRQLITEQVAAGQGETMQTMVSTRAIERLLNERPPGWFPDYDAMLLRALTGALDQGVKLQGSLVARWDYGQYRQLTIRHPVASQMPILGKYFNLGPVPMRGSPTSVLQYTGVLGPSLRMVMDLGNWDGSFTNIVAGESGQRFSLHYKDQWQAYLSGQSFPMPFDKTAARNVLTVDPGH